MSTPGRRTAAVGVIVIATLIVVVVAVLSLGVPREQPPVAASPTPTGAAASPTTSRATAQPASPASTPTQPAATSDPTVAQYVKPEVQRWQPTGTTLRRPIAGIDHASRVLWLRAGIAYTYAQPDASGFGTKPPYEVRITPTAGGGQRTLLTSPDPIPWLRFVSSSP